MGSFTVAGNAETRANETIIEILRAAALRDDQPYDVEAFSGYRAGDPREHGKDNAIDVILRDPRTGAEIPNYKSTGAFPIYETYARLTREEQQRLHPDLSHDWRWGGYFSGGKDKYGATDLMHFDLGGRGAPNNSMKGGSWESGLSREQAAIVAGLGAGTVRSATTPRSPASPEWARAPAAGVLSYAPAGAGASPAAAAARELAAGGRAGIPTPRDRPAPGTSGPAYRAWSERERGPAPTSLPVPSLAAALRSFGDSPIAAKFSGSAPNFQAFANKLQNTGPLGTLLGNNPAPWGQWTPRPGSPPPGARTPAPAAAAPRPPGAPPGLIPFAPGGPVGAPQARPPAPGGLPPWAGGMGLRDARMSPANFTPKSGGSRYDTILGRDASGKPIGAYQTPDGRTRQYDREFVGRGAPGAPGRTPPTLPERSGPERPEFAGEMLRRGMSGDEVGAMQSALLRAGYSVGPIDKDFGPMTDAALRAFQTDRGLRDVDGVFGPQTFAALRDFRPEQMGTGVDPLIGGMPVPRPNPLPPDAGQFPDRTMGGMPIPLPNPMRGGGPDFAAAGAPPGLPQRYGSFDTSGMAPPQPSQSRAPMPDMRAGMPMNPMPMGAREPAGRSVPGWASDVMPRPPTPPELARLPLDPRSSRPESGDPRLAFLGMPVMGMPYSAGGGAPDRSMTSLPIDPQQMREAFGPARPHPGQPFQQFGPEAPPYGSRTGDAPRQTRYEPVTPPMSGRFEADPFRLPTDRFAGGLAAMQRPEGAALPSTPMPGDLGSSLMRAMGSLRPEGPAPPPPAPPPPPMGTPTYGPAVDIPGRFESQRPGFPADRFTRDDMFMPVAGGGRPGADRPGDRSLMPSGLGMPDLGTVGGASPPMFAMPPPGGGGMASLDPVSMPRALAGPGERDEEDRGGRGGGGGAGGLLESLFGGAGMPGIDAGALMSMLSGGMDMGGMDDALSLGLGGGMPRGGDGLGGMEDGYGGGGGGSRGGGGGAGGFGGGGGSRGSLDDFFDWLYGV